MKSPVLKGRSIALVFNAVGWQTEQIYSVSLHLAAARYDVI